MPIAFQPARAAAALLIVLSCCLIVGIDGWTTGRATFYDDNTDGACRYGNDIPSYYAAWPDGQEGDPACGECYQVQCINRDFRDGYGDKLSRDGACLDEEVSVIVKVVDSCPCVHANYYSNQRWCCGDAPHLDLGREAFKKLAREKSGVIGARWQKVACPDGYASAKSYSSSSSSSSSKRSGDSDERSDDDTSSRSSSSSSSLSSSSSSSSSSGGSRYRSGSWSWVDLFGRRRA